MHADYLLVNIVELVSPAGDTGVCRGKQMDAVEIISKAAIAVSRGRIVWVGKERDWNDDATPRVSASGSVMPALVDPHTHACWAGNRLDDFEARARGVGYEDMLARGGGIRSTIEATNRRDDIDDDANLEGLTEEHALLLVDSGAATIEIKSGYGFSHAGELRMLETIRAVADRTEASVIPTLLIHVPPENRADRASYLAMVINELIPDVARQQLASAVDVFIERQAFSVDEAREIFRAATAAGLRVKAHVDQFHAMGGVQLAVEFNALSVDHLEVSGAAEIAAIAASESVAVLLPGVSLHLGIAAAPGRALIDAGAAVAVGTDLNPGSSPLFSTQVAMALAVRINKLTLAEALTASTVNAAAALGLRDTGRLLPGYRADFIVSRHSDWRSIPYTLGADPIGRLFIAGKELFRD